MRFSKPVKSHGGKGASLSCVALLLIVSLTGCAGSDVSVTGNPGTAGANPSTRGALVSASYLETRTGSQIQSEYEQGLLDQFGDKAGQVRASDGYAQWTSAMAQNSDASAEDWEIKYKSQDVNKKPIDLSGAVFFPSYGKNPISVPIVLYPHGTELKRDAVPSNGGKGGPEAAVGAFAALAFNFVVAMPDLPGMGQADPKAYHPYCHANSLAYSVADLFVATRTMLQSKSDKFTWNGDLYVVGYSEGGYSAMATVRELQNHPSDYPTFNLRGSACMAAPCDLSGAMRNVMLNPTKEFPAAFFLPYVIFGYNAVYPNSSFNPSLAMNSTLLDTRADGNISQWMDGSLKGADADVSIEKRLQVAPGHHAIPLNMLNPTFVSTQLADPAFATSVVGNALRENDLDKGWGPNPGTRMLIVHAYDDDCVPYANSVHAFQAFQTAGSENRVRFESLGTPGDGMTHVMGGAMALPLGFCWIFNGMPMQNP